MSTDLSFEIDSFLVEVIPVHFLNSGKCAVFLVHSWAWPVPEALKVAIKTPYVFSSFVTPVPDATYFLSRAFSADPVSSGRFSFTAGARKY